MIQRTPDIKGKLCTGLWDSGTQISPIRHQYTREDGSKGRPASIQISGVGSRSKKRSKIYTEYC
jgi:hypothetical protein